ncbi:MAG TPA: cytochrome c biogenesis protein CcdA [Chloroflexota bacterium]
MEPSLSPLLLVTALAAGMVSFASPCVLPLVPAYLGFITGRTAEELKASHGNARTKIATLGLSFVGGLAVIFALLGASASVLGQTLLQNLPLLWKLGGILVVIFGLQMLGIVKIPLLFRTARLTELKPNSGGSHAGAFVMGLAFGAGWTPCVGPFLAGLLGLASQQETVGEGVLLLLVYAFGLGIPFLLAGLAVDRSLSVMRSIRPHMVTIERFSGVLVILMGVLLFTEQLTRITSLLTKVFGNGLAL